MKFTFILKDKSAKDESLLLIVLRYQYRTAKISTGISIPPKSWNPKSNRVVQSWLFANSVNSRLSVIEAELGSLIHFAHKNEQDAEKLFAYVKRGLIEAKVIDRGEGTRPQTVLARYEDFIQAKSTGAGALKDNSLAILKTTEQHLKSIVDKNTTLEKLLTDSFVEKIHNHLAKRFTNNSYRKHLAIIKRFLHWAKEDNRKKGLPFPANDFVSMFKAPKFVKETAATNFALSLEELHRIEELDLSDYPALGQIRDSFLLCCYSGIRFSDIPQITPDIIHDGFITFEPKKTEDEEVQCIIPITPKLKHLLDRYPKGFYTSSSQKMNQNLKRIGQLAEMNEEFQIVRKQGREKIITTLPRYQALSWHCSRRTFATICSNAGIDKNTIMLATGHTKSETLDKYIKTDDVQIQHLLQTFQGISAFRE